MNSTLPLGGLAFLSGLLTGVANYSGLWLTVVRMTAVERPWLLLTASRLARSTLCLVVGYPLLSRGAGPAGAWLAGFLLSCLLAVQRLKNQERT